MEIPDPVVVLRPTWDRAAREAIHEYVNLVPDDEVSEELWLMLDEIRREIADDDLPGL